MNWPSGSCDDIDKLEQDWLLESIFDLVLYRLSRLMQMPHTPARGVLQTTDVLAALLTFQKSGSAVVLNTLLDLCMIHARVCCGE